MSRAGIDLSVLLQIATKPAQTPSVNSWAASMQAENLAAFGSIHPGFEGWKEEVARLRTLGLKGVKFHPDYQSFFVDDERVFPLYEALCEAQFIIVFHAGVDIGIPEPCHGTPERLARVVDAFPKATIVAAHMGGFLCWDDVEKHLAGRNLFFDTSYGLGYLGEPQFRRILKAHGADRVLFGTDSPWADQNEEKLKIEHLRLEPDVEQLVFSGNALRLLDRVGVLTKAAPLPPPFHRC